MKMTLEDELEGTHKALDDIAQHAAVDGKAQYYHDMMFNLVNQSRLPRQELVKYYFAAYYGYKEENSQG